MTGKASSKRRRQARERNTSCLSKKGKDKVTPVKQQSFPRLNPVMELHLKRFAVLGRLEVVNSSFPAIHRNSCTAVELCFCFEKQKHEAVLCTFTAVQLHLYQNFHWHTE